MTTNDRERDAALESVARLEAALQSALDEVLALTRHEVERPLTGISEEVGKAIADYWQVKVDAALDRATRAEAALAAVEALCKKAETHIKPSPLREAGLFPTLIQPWQIRAAIAQASVTSVEPGCTCGGMAACEQCQERAARTQPETEEGTDDE